MPVAKAPVPQPRPELGAGRGHELLARGRRVRSAATGAHVHASPSTVAAFRATVRRSATPGPARSRTGTSARSPASATATACGSVAAARSCRSTRATFADHAVGAAARRFRELDADRAAAAGRQDEFGVRAVQRGAAVAGTARRLNVTPDRIQSHGLDLSPALARRHRAGVGGGPGRRSDRTRESAVRQRRRRPARRSSRSRTSGITVKDSPQNTLVFVTRLDTGAPVPGAQVSIVNLENQRVWTRHDRRRRRRDRARNARPCATRERLVAVRVHRHRREGRRRRLCRQRLERRDQPWDFGIALRPQRGAAAAAGHGLHRPRRLPARRGGALQGHPAPQHAAGHPAAARRDAVFVLRARRPGPRGRRTHRAR